MLHLALRSESHENISLTAWALKRFNTLGTSELTLVYYLYSKMDYCFLQVVIHCFLLLARIILQNVIEK